MQAFDFRFELLYRVLGAPFGVVPATTQVRLGDGTLEIRFGPWVLRTPVSNVDGWQRTGPFAAAKTVGPAHLSLADRGVTFATNGVAGLCITFAEPVPAIEPSGRIRHPGATVTVADVDGLAEALGAAQAGASTSKRRTSEGSES